jgi:hypothetical protein
MSEPSEGSGCLRLWVAALILAAALAVIATIGHAVFR